MTILQALKDAGLDFYPYRGHWRVDMPVELVSGELAAEVSESFPEIVEDLWAEYAQERPRHAMAELLRQARRSGASRRVKSVRRTWGDYLAVAGDEGEVGAVGRARALSIYLENGGGSTCQQIHQKQSGKPMPGSCVSHQPPPTGASCEAGSTSLAGGEIAQMRYAG